MSDTETSSRPGRDFAAEYAARKIREGSYVRQFVAPGWISIGDACRLLGWPPTARARLLTALKACRLAGCRKRFLRKAMTRRDGRVMHLTWWELRLSTLRRLIWYQLQNIWEQDRQVSAPLRDVPLPAYPRARSRAKGPKRS